MTRLLAGASTLALGTSAPNHDTFAPSVEREPLPPLTVTVPTALSISGLGRSKLYELLAKGDIQSVRIGRRRLINFESLKAFLTSSGLDR
jgi:excisionase family DNA binding protein